MRKIDTYVLYKSDILEPDLNDFLNDRRDLRKAWHSAISLFHLSDWIFTTNKDKIVGNYTYRQDSGLVKAVSKTEHFANYIGQRFPDFQIIRGVAHSSKHLRLRAPPVGRNNPSGMPSDAANSFVPDGSFSTGFSGAFDIGEVMIEADPTPIAFAALAKSVLKMWNDIIPAEGW